MSLQNRLTALAQAVGADIKALNVKTTTTAVPIDPWHVVGAVGEPAPLNNWTTPAGLPGLMFRKDPLGRVWVYGVVQNGTNGTSCVNLPAGYRPFTNPTYFDILTANGAAGGFVSVAAAGSITVTTPNGQAFIDISFDTGLITAMPTGPQGPQGPQGVAGSSITVPMDTWHVVGTAGEPAYGAGFTSSTEVGFRKDPLGHVILRGRANNPSGAGGTIFTLPVGDRPTVYWRFALPCENSAGTPLAGVARGLVAPSGDVSVDSVPATTAYLSLSVIEFDTGLVTQMPVGPKGDKGDAGGVNVVTTLDWNTALAANFYRSTNDFLQQTVNGPGDALNPPHQAGIVSVHEDGSLTQRVWDLQMQVGYTRFRGSTGTWTAWAADLVRTPVLADVPLGGATPLDGDERYFQTAAMLTQGVMWKFRYHKASNKWHYVGGSDLLFTAAGLNAAAGVSNVVDLANLSFTTVLPGPYDVEWGARMYQNPSGPTSGNVLLYAEQMRGATAIYGASMDIWAGQLPGQTWSTVIPGYKTLRIASVVNGDLIRLRSSSINYSGAIESVFMRIRPVVVTM